MSRKKTYGPNGTAVNGIIVGLRQMGVAPEGTLADGVAGGKFDEAIANAKQTSDGTRRVLHLIMFWALYANPQIPKVEMHQWSARADQVILALAEAAADEASARG